MKKLYFTISVLLLIFSILFSLSSGSVNIPFFSTVKIVASKILSFDLDANESVFENILFNIRFPRILLSLLAGLSLSVVGVIFQAILRNPLADPYILGISSGTTFGVVISVLLGIEILSPLIGFVFCLLTIGFLFLFSFSNENSFQGNKIILIGVILNTFFGAGIMLVMTLSKLDLRKIIFLMIGNLSYLFSTDTLYVLYFVIFVTLILCVLIYYKHRSLNLLLLGSEIAQTTGVNINKLVIFLIIISSIIIGFVVSFTGPIGFVGLIIPHISRLIIGSNHKFLLPFSAVNGMAFLTICDGISKQISFYDLPVGVITSLIGGAFFLYLLKNRKSFIF